MKKLLPSICAAMCSVVGNAAAPELVTGKLSMQFTEPAQGMGLTGIRTVSGRESFFSGPNGSLLWQLDLVEPGHSEEEPLRISNITPAAETSWRQLPDGIDLIWEKLALPEHSGTLSVRVELRNRNDGEISMRLIPQLESKRYTMRRQWFPYFTNVLRHDGDRMLFPRGNIGSRYTDQPISGNYPGCDSQVQFFGFFRNSEGIYLGIHDPGASRKVFEYNSGNQLLVCTDAENFLLPGQSSIPEFEVVFAPAATPWAASRRYRQWAVTQKWCAKGKLSERKDIPSWCRNLSLWLNQFGDPEPVRKGFLEEAAQQPDPIAVHWYHWNIYPFDHHYPDFFPAKPGFAEAVKEMQADGDVVMPYINARLWDTALPSFATEARQGVVILPDGSPLIEDYGSGTKLGAMCPTTRIYREKITAAFEKLVDHYGVKAVYLDQIGAVQPPLCCNPEHGHPLGGGSWWQEGYRAMLAPLAARYGDRILIATENGAEPYIDTISHFLLWMAVEPDDFPSLPAVYCQYAWYFCSPAVEEDSDESFAALMSRSLLWGIQPGWLPWLHGTGKNSEMHQRRRAYIDRIIALRRAARNYLMDGELIDGATFVRPVGTVPVEFKRNGQYGGVSRPSTHTALQGAWWKAADGGGWCVAVANMTNAEIENAFNIPPTGREEKNWFRIDEKGTRTPVTREQDTIPFRLEPFGLAVFVCE